MLARRTKVRGLERSRRATRLVAIRCRNRERRRMRSPRGQIEFVSSIVCRSLRVGSQNSSCLFVSGYALQGLRKNSDSVEQSLLYLVGALIESIDYRGRAVPSAPRESCLARNANLQNPLFHGGARSIVVFYKRTFFVRKQSVSATPSRRAE